MTYSDTTACKSAIEISVVIPVRNEETSIRALLDALLHQTYPPKEIVITDGGSVDSTTDIVEEFIFDGAPARLIREKAAFPGRGRNVGVANAICEWIAFTDGGNKPTSDWLACLAKEVGPGVDVVYGSYVPVVDSFFKECAAIAYVPPAAVTNGIAIRPRFIASALMRREVWERVGGFPENLRSAEDLVFMNKIDAAGFRIARAPHALVYWTIQPNLWKTFKRFVVYAHNNIRAGLWREWQATIFLRYAVLTALALPAFFFGWRWLLVPFICWLLLMVVRAAQALRRNRNSFPASLARNFARLLLLLPIITAIDAAAVIGSMKWLAIDAFRARHARVQDEPER